MADTIRILLVDDHEVVRRGLQSLLQDVEGLEVAGEAQTAADAVKRASKLKPDVVVLDVRLPDGNGVEVCREIKSERPETRVLMLTSYADDEALFSSIMAGADGFLLKQAHGIDLIESIKKVCEGQSLIDPALTDKVIKRLRGEGKSEDEKLIESLTDQERRILSLIADGKTNRQIADEIFLAEKTVKNYVSSLLMKLGMSRRSEAAAFAARFEASKGAKEEAELPENWP